MQTPINCTQSKPGNVRICSTSSWRKYHQVYLVCLTTSSYALRTAQHRNDVMCLVVFDVFLFMREDYSNGQTNSTSIGLCSQIYLSIQHGYQACQESRDCFGLYTGLLTSNMRELGAAIFLKLYLAFSYLISKVECRFQRAATNCLITKCISLGTH